MKLINPALFRPGSVAVIVAVAILSHIVAKPLYASIDRLQKDA